MTAEPQPGAEPVDPDQGQEWVEFIGKELDREYTRRDLINSRSAGSITSATTLVTVSLAVVAVVNGEHYIVFCPLQIVLLTGALLFLLGAAVFGIIAGAYRGSFRVAAADDMDQMLGAQLWGINAIDARNYTASFNVGAIRTLRKGNKVKHRYLVAAFTSQALGILLLGIFVVMVIAD